MPYFSEVQVAIDKWRLYMVTDSNSSGKYKIKSEKYEWMWSYDKKTVAKGNMAYPIEDS